MEYKDKNGNIITKGDILFYSENIFGKDNFHYADAIEEVVKITPEAICTITRVFTPAYEGIGGNYKEIEDYFECSASIFDSKCYLVIGNIDKDSHKLTVEFAEKNFSLHGKKIGSN